MLVNMTVTVNNSAIMPYLKSAGNRYVPKMLFPFTV